MTFGPNDATETFSVTIANDALDEPNETVNLTLSNATGATLAAPATATLTINDDDDPAAPEVNIPTLSPWMLAALALALLALALRAAH